MKRVLVMMAVVLVAGLGCAEWAGGQSVASIARKSAGKKESTKPARVFTDQDVKHSSRDAPLSSSKKQDETADLEQLYYRKFMEQFHSIDECDCNYQQAKKDYDDAAFIYNGYLTQQGLIRNQEFVGSGESINLAYRKMVEAQNRMDEAKMTLSEAKQKLDDLQEEARQQGVVPGVFREAEQDWQEALRQRNQE